MLGFLYISLLPLISCRFPSHCLCFSPNSVLPIWVFFHPTLQRRSLFPSLWAICQSSPVQPLTEVYGSALQEDVFLCFYNKSLCCRQQTRLLYKSRHTWIHTGSWAQTPNPSSLKHKDNSHARAKFPLLSKSPVFFQFGSHESAVVVWWTTCLPTHDLKAIFPFIYD